MGKVNQLQEALAAYPDVKPRSMEWCLKLIDALFKSKRVKVLLPHTVTSPSSIVAPACKAVIQHTQIASFTDKQEAHLALVVPVHER